MAAANEAEAVGRVAERAAEHDGGSGTARIHDMHGIGMRFIRCRALAHDAKLGMHGHMDALRQERRAQHRQADAEVHDHTVGEFLRNALCDKGFNQAFFHLICPP